MDKRLALFVPVTCGAAFFLGLELGGFQLILLQAAQFFNLNNVMMGAMVTSQFIALTLGPLLVGWAADRYGKKTILLISLPLFTLGCFGAAFSGTIWIFMAAVFVVGIGYSITECIASSALSDSFPGRESNYINLMQTGFCLGAVLSPQIFSRLIAMGLVSWRAVFVCAGSGLAVFFPLLCLSHCKRPVAASDGSTMPTGETRRIVSPMLFILIIGMMTYISMESGISFFADAIFVTEYGNTSLGAYAISAFWLSMTITRFVFAIIKVKMQNAVILGFAATSIFLLLMLFLKDQWIQLGLIVCMGAALGPIWPMILGIGTSSFREKSGTVGSILYSSGGIGGIITPVLIGWVSEWAGFYGGFWLLVAASAIGLFTSWFGLRRR
jgi:fucose permease